MLDSASVSRTCMMTVFLTSNGKASEIASHYGQHHKDYNPVLSSYDYVSAMHCSLLLSI